MITVKGTSKTLKWYKNTAASVCCQVWFNSFCNVIYEPKKKKTSIREKFRLKSCSTRTLPYAAVKRVPSRIQGPGLKSPTRIRPSNLQQISTGNFTPDWAAHHPEPRSTRHVNHMFLVASGVRGRQHRQNRTGTSITNGTLSDLMESGMIREFIFLLRLSQLDSGSDGACHATVWMDVWIWKTRKRATGEIFQSDSKAS